MPRLCKLAQKTGSEFANSVGKRHVVQFSSQEDAEKLGYTSEEQVRFGTLNFPKKKVEALPERKIILIQG